MLCSTCRREIAEYSNFCYFCGSRQTQPASGATAPAAPMAGKRLMRSSTDIKVAGVCAGFADYFGWDVTVVRLLWVIMTIMPVPVFPGIIGYIVAWIVMPVAPRPLPAPAPAPAPQSSAAPSAQAS
jgi:phage shock protein PspC (stress-responsive transcriptional regulator)